MIAPRSFASECEQLTNLMPPPRNGDIPKIDWDAVVRDVGRPLPDDYRWFCDTYGIGTINRFAWIFHPYVRRPKKTLKELIDGVRQALQEFIDLDTGENPAVDAKFRNVSTLLPCGGTDNGHHFVWVMDGNPNEWTIGVFDNKGYAFDSHEKGVVRFLLSLLTKRSALMDSVIAGAWFDSARFVPANEPR